MNHDFTAASQALQIRQRAGIKTPLQNSMVAALKVWPGLNMGAFYLAQHLDKLQCAADDVYALRGFTLEPGDRKIDLTTLVKGVDTLVKLGAAKWVVSKSNPQTKYFRAHPLRMETIRQLTEVIGPNGFSATSVNAIKLMIWLHYQTTRVPEGPAPATHKSSVAEVIGLSASGLDSSLRKERIYQLYFHCIATRVYLQKKQEVLELAKAWYDFFISCQRWKKEPF